MDVPFLSDLLVKQKLWNPSLFSDESFTSIVVDDCSDFLITVVDHSSYYKLVFNPSVDLAQS